MALGTPTPPPCSPLTPLVGAKGPRAAPAPAKAGPRLQSLLCLSLPLGPEGLGAFRPPTTLGAWDSC